MRKGMRILAGVCALVLTAAVTAGTMVHFGRLREQQRILREKQQTLQHLIRWEKDWILRNQLPDGAICYGPWDPLKEGQSVVPYFSNLAVLGLLSGPVTYEDILGAQAYISWYLDHLNTPETDPANGDGTIWDHVTALENGVISTVSTGKADSVDSYAATFLAAAGQLTEVWSSELLEQRSQDLFRVIDALLRTISQDGLSQVSMTNETHYLMDNCEVYAGLLGAEKLLGQLEPEGDRLLRVVNARKDLALALETELWSERMGCYYVGSLGDNPVDPQEGSFYPHDTAQLFPICWGLIEPESPRAQMLYDRFCNLWVWQELEHMETGESHFYWCMLAYAAAKMGDGQRLGTFLETYYGRIQQEGRGYPLYIGETGWMAMCLSAWEEALAEPPET